VRQRMRGGYASSSGTVVTESDRAVSEEVSLPLKLFGKATHSRY
jgi:hypothetical protein